MTRLLILLSLGLLAFPPAATAQDDDVKLRGIRAVNAQVDIRWDDRITTTTEQLARKAMMSRFTLELRRLGLVVDSTFGNPNLWCLVDIHLVERQAAFFSSVTLSEMVRNVRLNLPQWADTWTTSSVGSVGRPAPDARGGEWGARHFPQGAHFHTA